MITTVTVNTAIDKTYIVDNFGLNGVFRVQRVMAQAGGKGLNVARVVKALGEEVVATGFIGGHNGMFIKECLVAEGLKGDFVNIAGESRICLNVLDPAGRSQTELLEPGPEITAQEAERLKERVKDLARLSQVVTLSGSLAGGLPTDYYAQIIKIVHREGARVILDSSGEALKEGLKAGPYMVKPNLQEAEALAGKPLADEKARKEFLRELIGAGVKAAVLSLGEAGALVGTGEGFFRVVPPGVQTVNTVGCGDAFVAGFAVGLARGQGVKQAARLGTAAAAASAASWKAGECRGEQIPALALEVQVFEV
ncbi:tagatose-6-phosphate kinase [Moorella thermoacetica]|uniref:Tagatose-6-phosphate kinase n=1 Tax=Neomoorella thermoacetica TaxID=1525 RepID=A0A1J5NS46_NEOTH|nr:tagatose-6-phosphate kinase [Moorella thermoacetica]